jgi:hypothetical protein
MYVVTVIPADYHMYLLCVTLRMGVVALDMWNLVDVSPGAEKA